MSSIKKILFAGLFVCFTTASFAQVKLSLTLLPDQQTYLVSMTPEVSWEPPLNMTASIQVTIVMPTGKPFTAGNITSFIPGVTWSDNAYVDKPASVPDLNFVCFGLNEHGTKSIPYEAGVETPLFTFKNLEPECVGKIELLNNDDPSIEKVVEIDHFNLTQNLTVLGARGNAFVGILNSAADCTVTSSVTTIDLIEKIRVFPIPVVDFLNVRWVNPAESANIPGSLRVFTSTGDLVSVISLTKLPGEQQVKVEVGSWPTGLYVARFITDSGKTQSFKFTVLRT